MSSLLRCLTIATILLNYANLGLADEHTDRTAEEKPALRVGPVDVAPVGWRRTLNGWERAETWAATEQDSQAVVLHRVIKRQQEAVQASAVTKRLSTLMGFLNQIDPITLVCCQVTLLALYIALVFHREAKTTKKQCPNPIAPSRLN